MATTTLTAALAAVDHYQYVEARTPRDLDPVLTPTLGVEVTDSQVADRCDLGNLDPQHGHHREGAVVGGDGRGGAHCTAAPMAAAEEALGETGGAVQRPRYVCPALAEACAERAAAIHRAVCAVDDGTGGVEAVRLAVAAARRAIS